MTNNCESYLINTSIDIKSDYLKEFCKEKMKCINNQYFSFLRAILHCFEYNDIIIVCFCILIAIYLKYY